MRVAIMNNLSELAAVPRDSPSRFFNSKALKMERVLLAA
jgi:hypothetical protein